ncbi:hypothetical protein POPTR_006G087800v4 [Populus trichocarpa]|uniref:RING-type E3 ubiquitin transferase n=1 Tax=Populus trichocarpa TaxID=3694 RepID=B9HBT6_POPTR|nr:E3 ubiquitin-protein ligase RDUF2 [Populus trichocarpa]XP_024460134.1 E3 ubiquitin-protein ligase RDUF2 [Populus trichocarpa]KAI5584383.1 hypothetical protein BDE02_06G076900 [Populus trichocarpa]PNT30576.1 hypothetical protein POPTR_006G087800v4 [Populus trichocarpa]|eukprot:XP_002309072.1 E3 ubiquitin-protein ligase RDUF2 [Populus trichocarpa]
MASSIESSFWCYRCNRSIRLPTQDSILCPDCGGGFIEEIGITRPHHRLTAAHRTRLRTGGDHSPFNPVIILRGATTDLASGNFELYYDDGAASGLRPLPASISELLMDSGFERLLDQLTQMEINGVGRFDHPQASKAAIESMPVIKILNSHVSMESQCAVCKEAFEINTEAREMPCNHIYHSDCILPWLSIRNSCPVCRHELPTETGSGSGRNSPESDEETVGLMIWRLPGRGFAVGRFSGGRRAAERELPLVFTEMDGGFNNAGLPRSISWAPDGRRSRESGGVGRAFRNFFSFFRRIGRRSSNHSGQRA